MPTLKQISQALIVELILDNFTPGIQNKKLLCKPFQGPNFSTSSISIITKCILCTRHNRSFLEVYSRYSLYFYYFRNIVMS